MESNSLFGAVRQRNDPLAVVLRQPEHLGLDGYLNFETRSGVCGADAYRWKKPDTESVHDILPWLELESVPPLDPVEQPPVA